MFDIAAERSDVVEMSDNVRRLMVLYGSQTGTAQDVAERIERDAIRRHFSVTVKPLDQYDIVCQVTVC